MTSFYYFNVLYERMCIVTPAARIRKNRRNAICSATKMAQLSNVSQRNNIETILTFMGIALCFVKFDI